MCSFLDWVSEWMVIELEYARKSRFGKEEETKFSLEYVELRYVWNSNSPNNSLLGIYCAPGMVLGAEDVAVTHIRSGPSWS